MGIFDRFRRVVKSNINDLISKAENPEKMLNQLIVDMNEQLIESKKSVASAIADEKRLERQLNQEQTQSEDWENKAVLAVKAGKDDLARQALVRKQEHDDYVKNLRQQWEAQHGSVEQLKQSLRQGTNGHSRNETPVCLYGCACVLGYPGWRWCLLCIGGTKWLIGSNWPRVS